MAKKNWLNKKESKPNISADIDTPFIPDAPFEEADVPPPAPEMAKKHNAENIHNNVNTREYGFKR
jgi:hypothetical protein